MRKRVGQKHFARSNLAVSTWVGQKGSLHILIWWLNETRFKTQSVSVWTTICVTTNEIRVIRVLVLYFSFGVRILWKTNVLSSTCSLTTSNSNTKNTSPQCNMLYNEHSKWNQLFGPLNFIWRANRIENKRNVKHAFTDIFVSKQKKVSPKRNVFLQSRR